MKIVVVYGSPCSGKSTYVHKKMGSGDVVYDYDSILAAITTNDVHSTGKSEAHDIVLNLRDSFIKKTQQKEASGIAYVITQYPTDHLKKILPDNTEYILIESTQKDCLQRLKNDDTRQDKEGWAEIINRWFSAHGKEVKGMQIEVRGDGVHISGYVNATEKKSRPVVTPHGKVIEEIEPHVFERAISRAGDISVTLDHDKTHIYASTGDGTLELYEDSIGLHADVQITDPDLIELARKGKIRGWSFGMYNVQDELEQRAEDLPLRKIKSLDIDHVSLIAKKTPIYSATSVEVRAGEEIDLEIRAMEEKPRVTEMLEKKMTSPSFDNTAFWRRVEAIKK